MSASSDGQQGVGSLLELLPLSCWSAVVDLLTARDLLSLSLSSNSVQQLLSSTPGIWSQAACNCLLASTSTSSTAAGSTAVGSSTSSAHSSNQRHQHQRQQQPAVHAAPAAAAVEGASSADAAAQRMLSAFTALAYSCQRLKPQLKPQCYLLPPWLAAQPGKARGFARVDGQTLNPGLVLTEAQVHRLSLGSLSGARPGVSSQQLSPVAAVQWDSYWV